MIILISKRHICSLSKAFAVGKQMVPENGSFKRNVRESLCRSGFVARNAND